ncbi:hypothetical protein [Candidatus Methanoperedens nitratireducens]|uniref:PepSY domain-containing protein n=1 Tax=Candidatus Methanoperedens nitratireducens TaxID=1392998 RepID=A0A284VUB3_9EURY|nr:hypothetical protein [Candidatus Methanoperedens nitroreducens]SNQ62809.1 hypothetical protein MNV_90023 [Candidatus Methanoperedens nitroreducens]
MDMWKALALVMICLLAVAVGLRFTYTEAHAFQLSEEQKIFAINAAKDELRDEMGNSDYNITVQNRGRILPAAGGDKKVVRVVLTRENITLTALVDMDTGDVVEKSRMESSGWMAEYHHENQKRWGHQRLLGR